MRELTASAGLSDQQAELIRNLVVLGLPPELAGERSGYHPKSVYRTLRIPAVAAAVAEGIQFELHTASAGALHVAKVLMHDDKVSPRVRADIAFKILDRAGHVVPSNKGKPPEKALSEMSQAELLAFIERNQAEIDKAEGELAAAAKDVSAPLNAPKQQAFDAKPLNYLD
jgi:hypothetical protein